MLWRLSPRDQERLWQIVLEHGFNLPVVRQLSRFWSERVENHLALLKFTELEFDEVVDQNREQLLEEELCRILRCAEARVVSGGDNWIVVRDGSDSDEAGDELGGIYSSSGEGAGHAQPRPQVPWSDGQDVDKHQFAEPSGHGDVYFGDVGQGSVLQVVSVKPFPTCLCFC